MVLVFEEKEKAVKLLVNPRKPVEKAMQVGRMSMSWHDFVFVKYRRWQNI